MTSETDLHARKNDRRLERIGWREEDSSNGRETTGGTCNGGNIMMMKGVRERR